MCRRLIEPPSIMDRPTRFDHQSKIVCIGNSGVGKSSLLLRFCDDEWSPSFISTIGVDFKHRIVNLDGFRLRLLLWDTAGQERYKSITQTFYRGSEGVLLVYDVTDYSSFEGISAWVKDLNDSGIGNSEHTPKLLVGNKTDKTGRAVSTEQGRRLAESIGAQFCETSAKYSEGVIAAFMMLAWSIKAKTIDVSPAFRFRTGPSGQTDLGPTSEVVVPGKSVPRSRLTCCSS